MQKETPEPLVSPYTLRLQVCPEKQITPKIQFFSDGIGTPKILFDREGSGFLGMDVSENSGTPKHPKMIIFSRKTHGSWVPPFKETPG